MLDIALKISITLTLLSILLNAYRLTAGPDMPDRILALDPQLAFGQLHHRLAGLEEVHLRPRINFQHPQGQQARARTKIHHAFHQP